ncbi:hypothetical protein AXK56_16710 [Tsukamurella pulmonis]|nr:hypothetical protein AXK56_16710 [Tsukamurella pulmonis]SUQ39385.1 Uncharacterised protein [Tsukamurella pulmonis]
MSERDGVAAASVPPQRPYTFYWTGGPREVVLGATWSEAMYKTGWSGGDPWDHRDEGETWRRQEPDGTWGELIAAPLIRPQRKPGLLARLFGRT